MLWWIPGAFVACGLLAWGTNSLALNPWRRARQAHWTERARLLFPVRAAAALNVYLLPANAILLSLLLAPDGPWPAVGVAAWLGTLAAGWRFDHEIMPWLPLAHWCREIAVVWIFRFTLWLALLLTALAVPANFGWSTALAGAAVVALYAFLLWGGGEWLSRRLGLFSPAPASLRAIVQAAAERAGARVRAVWTLRASAANAVAFPFTQSIAFTERAVQHCQPDELAAIAAHEAEHLTESNLAKACRFLGSLAWVPWVSVRPLWNLFDPFGPIAIACLGALTWLIHFGTVRMSQRLEQRADAGATRHDLDMGAFARALARLYELNQVPAVIGSRRLSHPQLYDRLIAAGATPDYPRPEPARALAWNGHAQASLLGILLALVLARLLASI